MQIYVNGHDWLAWQMNTSGSGSAQRDNAFTQLDVPHKAQQLADQFSRLPWVRQLGIAGLARSIPSPCAVASKVSNYYWVIPQVEYAPTSSSAAESKLAALYGRSARITRR